MLKIWFKDNISPQTPDGKVFPLSEPNIFYANTRLVHNYVPPVITEDTWNGKTFPVQINNWDGYQIQLASREIATNMISKIQSCKSIAFEETETGEMVEVDTLSSGAITIEPLGRNGTVNQAFILNIKSEKLPSYPALVYQNLNQLQVISEEVPYNFYTDFDIIPFITDSERETFTYDDGIDISAKTMNKYGLKLVFYLFENEAISLKSKVEFAKIGEIFINPNTDNSTNLEAGTCVLTLLTEKLYKCEVEVIVGNNTKYYNQTTITAGEQPEEDQIFVIYDDDSLVIPD